MQTSCIFKYQPESILCLLWAKGEVDESGRAKAIARLNFRFFCARPCREKTSRWLCQSAVMRLTEMMAPWFKGAITCVSLAWGPVIPGLGLHETLKITWLWGNRVVSGPLAVSDKVVMGMTRGISGILGQCPLSLVSGSRA